MLDNSDNDRGWGLFGNSCPSSPAPSGQHLSRGRGGWPCRLRRCWFGVSVCLSVGLWRPRSKRPDKEVCSSITVDFVSLLWPTGEEDIHGCHFDSVCNIGSFLITEEILLVRLQHTGSGGGGSSIKWIHVLFSISSVAACLLIMERIVQSINQRKVSSVFGRVKQIACLLADRSMTVFVVKRGDKCDKGDAAHRARV